MEHVDQATEILVDIIKEVQRDFPDWSREKQLKGLSHSLIIISSYSDHTPPPLLQKRKRSRRGEYFLLSCQGDGPSPSGPSLLMFLGQWEVLHFGVKIGIVSCRDRGSKPEEIFSQRLSLANS